MNLQDAAHIQQVANEVLFPEMARLLAEGRTVTFTPKGQSMLPFIRGEKDSVVMEQADKYQVGDIILFTVPHTTTGQPIYFLHRLIRIETTGTNEATYVCRGDGNIRGEEHTTRARILGRVTRIIRPNGQPKRPSRATLWQLLYPLRRYLLKIYRKLQ